MSILVVELPNGTQSTLRIADNTLVYDGSRFVEPIDAKYVSLYDVPVGVPIGFGISQQVAQTASYISAAVVAFNPVSVIATDANVQAEPDPSNGLCICFITCKGTWISFVQVTNSQ